MSEEATITKLRLLFKGKEQVMSDEELDTLSKLDASNVIRTRPNPQQVGVKDRWIAWVEQRDVGRYSD